MPKVLGSCSPIELDAFYPPPFSSEEHRRLHLLCPVRALRVYSDRTEGLRKGNQLFVSWAKPHVGKPVSKQRLSHWIVEAITLAYTSKEGSSASCRLASSLHQGFSDLMGPFQRCPYSGGVCCCMLGFAPHVRKVLQVGCYGSNLGSLGP